MGRIIDTFFSEYFARRYAERFEAKTGATLIVYRDARYAREWIVAYAN